MQIHAHLNLQFVTQTIYEKITYHNCINTSLNSIYSCHFKSIQKFDREWQLQSVHKTAYFLKKKKYLRWKDSISKET